MILRNLIFTLLFVFTALLAYSTHNRAGEVTYRQISPLTIEATVTTYTKASSTGADRDTIFVEWGDGTSEFIARTNGNGNGVILAGEDIKVNTYTQQHTYPANGRYIIAFQDPNRVNNIQNVNFPNSVDIPFFVQTTLTLIESQFQGPNNSVILLQPPIDFACAGMPFLHNPNAFDPDGDSLSYSLVTPLQDFNVPVPRYVRPDLVFPGPGNTLTINEMTGDVLWDSPPSAGEYNIAIRIDEFRDGVLLNSVIRDMQILVIVCNDTPPEITVDEEICVIAGEVLNIPVTVDDIDSDQQVRISATGGPFIQDFSPAFLEGSVDFQDAPFTRNFVWETKCEHISDQFYTVVFRGQDNSRGDGGNAVLKNLRIKVLGPPPEDLQSTIDPNSETININWEQPYACENALNDFFLGFRVYRRIGPNTFDLDSCENGLENRGYDVVRFRTTDSTNGRYTFTDSDVTEGRIYCYRVTATFADQTSTGQPFNIVESIPSDEICMQLRQDVPLLTRASVIQTDNNSGEMDVKWVKPKISDFDTITFPGPYTYRLLRSSDGINYDEIFDIETPFLGPDIELGFIDTGLDTENIRYDYQVDFESQGLPYSSSISASSLMAELVSSDRMQVVSANFDVPWNNFNYRLEELVGNDFQFLEESNEPLFTLNNLENDIEFCYRIQALGTYRLDHTPDTLFNFSQIVCGVPIDSIGPCPPVVSVDNPCNRTEVGQQVDFVNVVTWLDDLSCLVGDLSFFRVYFSIDSTSEIILLTETFDKEFSHIPDLGINGCYRVAAVDTLGNEGPLSEPVCVPNCPIYTLPNTFTPNSDGANDAFVPRENRFVANVDFTVFNRWGNELFHTADPALNWDGRDQNDNEVPPGVYFYVCTVFENSGSGVVEYITLEGHIQIFR